MSNLEAYTKQVALDAKTASRDLAVATGAQKISFLKDAANALRKQTTELISRNKQDLDAAPDYGLNPAAIDRLRLTEERIEGIAQAVEQVASLPDPVGVIRSSRVRPNGLVVKKVAVPIGVVFFIYESRPNVTVDAAALCIQSGNAVILRGGKEAFHSNQAFYEILRDSLKKTGLPEHAIQMVNTTDREAVGHFLKCRDEINVTIPRGGKSLIERVSTEATMPVMKHFDGNCHVYVDKDADLNMASEIVINSKCQRPGVCNAAETLLIHATVAERFLPEIVGKLKSLKVEIRGCSRCCDQDATLTLATEEDFYTEYLDLILSVKIVDSLEEAIQHINTYGSGHTESIVTNNLRSSEQFTGGVDSSAVMVNASTRFNDGGEFGLGAEIGISTDKYHARGPCGLEELTIYKYVVQGNGQIR